MNEHKYQSMIVLSLAFFFGWLLSFPFYGPVLQVFMINHPPAGLNNLPLIFVFFHAVFLILAGILLRNIYIWKKVMLTSLTVIILFNIVFMFLSSTMLFISMGIIGALSSVYILGWSCIYSMCIPSNNRIKTMAATIIIANAVFVIINWLSTYLSSFSLLIVATLPLIFSIIILIKIPESLKLKVKPAKNTENEESLLPLPKTLIIIFCIFVAGLFLNGGFMYNIMLPSFEEGLPLFKNYTYLPYILILLIIFKFSNKIQYYLLVYMGVTLLGMSFVSFALLGESIIGLFLTHTLVESSFAFLDLFVWVALGNLAFIYGAPYQFFGYVLGVMVSSILAGNIIGGHIFQVGETHRLIMAVFAAAAIFLTHLVIPWLNQRINKDFTSMVAVTMEDETPSEEEDLFDILLNQLVFGENLTPREKEVTRLILKGLKNKEIAGQLFISDNTLKSHLRNIYPKFGVTQKRELLSIALHIKKKNNNL